MRELAEALAFPAQYGHNLNALNDYLSDVAVHEYGTDEAATGTVLVLRRIDAFATREPRAAHSLLDIFAGQARRASLFGHRMLCLVQSDDPGFAVAPVGATPVPWGPAESLDSNRRS
jgi:hypothetical protein